MSRPVTKGVAKTDEQKLVIRLRYKAKRRKLHLVRSSERDTGLPEFGKFALLKSAPKGRSKAARFPYSIADVERILNSTEWQTL